MHPSSFAAKPVCCVRSRQGWIAQAKVTKQSTKLTSGKTLAVKIETASLSQRNILSPLARQDVVGK